MQDRQLAIHGVHFHPKTIVCHGFCLAPCASLWLHKPERKATVAYELFWQLVLGMTESSWNMWIFNGSRRRHPPTTSTFWWLCRCRSTTAYLSDTEFLLSSQLTSVSGGRSPICHLGRHFVARITSEVLPWIRLMIFLLCSVSINHKWSK